MSTPIPTAAEVKAALEPLTLKHLEALFKLSGVPVSTLYKIKGGKTENPGIDTVRLFMPHIEKALADPQATAEAQG